MKKYIIGLGTVCSLSLAAFAANHYESSSFKEETTTAQYKRTESIRCSATAVSTGQRCKNWTYNWNGRCHVHQ